MRKILPAVVMSAFALTGCFERPVVDEGDGTKTKTETSPAAAKSSAAAKSIERTSMAGLWQLQMSNQISREGHVGWVPIALLKISKSKSGTYVPELIAVPPQSPPLRVAEFNIAEKSAHLVLTHQQGRIDLRVALQKSEALGNILRVPDGFTWTVPARLLATTETRLKPFQPVPHEHHEDLNRAVERLMKQQETQAVDAFIKQNPRNPLSCFAIYRCSPLLAIRTTDTPRPDPRDIREHVQRLGKLEAVWGRRAALLGKLEFARHLAEWVAPGGRFVRKSTNLEIASEIVRDAEAPEWTRLLSDGQKGQLADLKKYLALEKDALAVVTSTDPQLRTAAMARLNRDIDSASIYAPWLSFVLAEGNRKAGNFDKAAEQYARLLVMPSATFDLKAEVESRWRKMPDVRKGMEDAWTRKTGGNAGLEEYLSAAYRKLMHDLLPDVVATRPAPFRKRIHLCELFTSCDDPGCVGADIATQVLQRTHEPVDVVVLRYHLDDPGPNPLVCNDAKLRGFDYQISGVPTIHINGKSLAPSLRSTMAGMPRVMTYLRSALRQDSAADPPAYKVRVSASARAGTLDIKAEVDGPMKADPDLRLRLVLAEDRIPYTGKNGIRYHDLVVRSMPAGIDGVPLTAGKTAWSKTVDLSDLSSRLRDFLTSLEEKTSEKLSVKPVGFKTLHVVAFVQSTKGRRDILQVAKTVVGGLDAPAGAASKKPAATPAKKP